MLCLCGFELYCPWVPLQHVISHTKSSGHLISVSALKVHFDISLIFLKLFLLLRRARFHYIKNCKNTTKLSLRFQILSSYN